MVRERENQVRWHGDTVLSSEYRVLVDENVVLAAKKMVLVPENTVLAW